MNQNSNNTGKEKKEIDGSWVTLPPKTGQFDLRVLLFILTAERRTFHEESIYS